MTPCWTWRRGAAPPRASMITTVLSIPSPFVPGVDACAGAGDDGAVALWTWRRAARPSLPGP